jgi:hypothetical protein
VVTLPEASNDTLVLVKACLHGVRKTWRGRLPLFQGRGRRYGPGSPSGLAAGVPGAGATRPGARSRSDGLSLPAIAGLGGEPSSRAARGSSRSGSGQPNSTCARRAVLPGSTNFRPWQPRSTTF